MHTALWLIWKRKKALQINTTCLLFCFCLFIDQ